MSTKRKAPVKLAAPVARTSARIPNKSVIDESKASIAGPDALQPSQVETIEISSDNDSDEDISDAESPEEEQQTAQESAVTNTRQKTTKQKTNGQSNDEESDAEGTSPSFGELLRAENDIIDVPSALNGAVVSQPSRNAIVPPTHQSLTTVLSQALRTDDTDLLESCLHTTDLPTIRNTIERLDSALAGTLLTKLAARLYRRPGRAGNLMTWVQWTLVAHGGALASQPKVIHSLSGLQKVLAERAKGLSSLLALKGKLDMLEGQMDLRRKMSRPGLHNGDNSDSDEEEDEDVIWVEGEDEAARTPGRRRGLDTDFDDSDDDVPITNGFVGDSDDEEESAGEEDDSDAEESLDEDEVDHEDVDESMGEDEESDVEAASAPPSKLQKTAGSFGKRR
ncbi:UTP5 [Fusarium beomiforme]|uniref:UTP5 n=1 Tax=Fusarium beomiforme TaxID=44412 RepID=A0A9P5A6W9_9HYPO|nr:UTP5 [Fusarium beomiforme]